MEILVIWTLVVLVFGPTKEVVFHRRFVYIGASNMWSVKRGSLPWEGSLKRGITEYKKNMFSTYKF